jgi:hypothetical protein
VSDILPDRYGRCDVVVDDVKADIGRFFVLNSEGGGRLAGKPTPGGSARAGGCWGAVVGAGLLASSPSSSSSSDNALWSTTSICSRQMALKPPLTQQSSPVKPSLCNFRSKPRMFPPSVKLVLSASYTTILLAVGQVEKRDRVAGESI